MKELVRLVRTHGIHEPILTSDRAGPPLAQGSAPGGLATVTCHTDPDDVIRALMSLTEYQPRLPRHVTLVDANSTARWGDHAPLSHLPSATATAAADEHIARFIYFFNHLFIQWYAVVRIRSTFSSFCCQFVGVPPPPPQYLDITALASVFKSAETAKTVTIITSAKEVMFLPVCVCLSVCLCVRKITQKVMDGSFRNFEGTSSMA